MIRRNLWIAVVWIAIFLFLVFAVPGKAHYMPGTHNAIHAIQEVWCGKANMECWQGNEAINVAKCEAASYWTRGIPTEARNGQYLGMFQMGKQERKDYGHGPDPWTQARAAHYYWVISGRDWSPWSCKP